MSDENTKNQNPYMALWEAWCTPPREALKPIMGGRLKGKSDINPTWRMRAVTEQLGPCGDGWKYTIDKLWTEPGASGEVCAFAMVTVQLRIMKTGEWADAIPGIGGSMLIENEKKGLTTNDEAYKMAVTDALSVAFKSLGVAADVYMGMYDSKYGDYQDQPPLAPPPRPAPPAPQPQAAPLAHTQAPGPAPAQLSPAPAQAQQQPPRALGQGQVGAHCPTCQGYGLYDNRSQKRGPASPDFRCIAQRCKTGIWQMDKQTGAETPHFTAVMDELFGPSR
jgi:hypothetical protein